MADYDSVHPLESAITLPRSISIDTLTEHLKAADVPVALYGTGDAKTLRHLLEEIHEGETMLTVTSDGKVMRNLSLVAIDVFCTLSDGNDYILKEDRQEFNDGRIIRRPLESSLGEKLKPNEDPEAAVVRALKEELQLEDAIKELSYKGFNEKSFSSPTYPGIVSNYKVHNFDVDLTEASFNSDGYKEVQNDKTNYYIWQLLQPKSEE